MVGFRLQGISDEQAGRRPTEGPATVTPGPDYRSQASLGAPGSGDRLALSDKRFRSVCRAGWGQSPLPARLVAGLLILKHMHDLSDEVLCARWLENPYHQFFCGEESFQHRLPFERSPLTRWRQRLGEAQLSALIQESLLVAHKTGALAPKDLGRSQWTPWCSPRTWPFRPTPS